ncbi:MAG: SDR family NAD(P)-dependent oxidoreductase [Planctomycetota bacterium]
MSEIRDFGPTPLAIVGVGCIFPKAQDKLAFWSNIREGVDAITEIPSTHWNPEDYFNPDPKAPDHVYARRGGFLSPVDFDSLAFGISPNNLDATDSSQLLGLVVADAALRDAGYGPDRDYDRSKVSVVLGVTGTLELVIPLGARLGHPLWRKALKEAGVADEIAEEVVRKISDGYVGWQENSFPGLLGNVVAGRIANRLNLGGTNCVVDAACASSLSAVHLAGLELAAGRADMVLTGGVDTFNDIFMYMCFSKTPALSPTGDARPFSMSGDGTILGEGIGMVVLKRLADAERDNDRIYAVIRSVGSSSDGKGNAIYAPSSEGQSRALRTAYKLAEITPDTVELVEAHGTGTKVGDATEASALVQVYREDQRPGIAPPEPWCAIGSVKSQIGHTKAAAGIAGVIKAALALHEKVLPPTIKVSAPVEPLATGASPFYVNTIKRPWVANDRHPRRAVVSAFGFGGSNFHCVLEEFASVKPEIDWSGDIQILALSADSVRDLETKLAEWPGDLPWQQQSAAFSDARREFDVRQKYRLLMVVEREKSELSKLIVSASNALKQRAGELHWSSPDGIYFGAGDVAGKLAILFPGQGSQYVGMFRDLACQFPRMQEIFAEANRTLGSDETSSCRLTDLIYPPPVFSDAERERQDCQLRATENAQPAIGAVSLGVLAILEEFGVSAEVVAGHSFGELSALCAAGRYDLPSLFFLSRLRGRLMASSGSANDRGAMLAVQASLETISDVAREEGIRLVVANKNSPSQVVLSGVTSEVRRAEEIFEKRRIRNVRLPVSAAFHSELVAEASKPFHIALEQIPITPGKVPVFANSTAEQYPDNPKLAREILANQLARPVEFVDQVRNLHQWGARTFLEVGPGGRLTGLVKAILEGRDFVACAVDASEGKRSGEFDLARALSQLAARGHSVEVAAWDPRAGRRTSLTKRPGAHTVPICGANYVKPKKATDSTKPKLASSPKELPVAPNPSSPPPRVSEPNPRSSTVTPSTPIPSPTSSSSRIAPPQIAQISNQPSITPSLKATVAKPLTGSGHLKTSDVPMPTSIPSGTLMDALRVTQQNLAAIQSLQSQTADLHRRFLEGQEAAQRNLFELVQAHRDLVQASLAGANSLVAALPAASASVAIATTKVEAVIPPASPVPTQAATIPATQPLTARVQVPPAALSAEPVTPAPAKARSIETATKAVKAPAKPRQDFLSAILEVIAEKTGYPAEMLQLEMELDGDLGIDSIKRVEIFSSFQEKFPNAPVVQSDQLGSLRTIRDVVDFLGSEFDEPVVEEIGTADQAAGSVSIGDILGIIAEKTGYPAEMLQLEMELDGDLGIDSIKRVEIFSAFQEKFPEAPVVQSDQLGTLRTIRDVIDFLGMPAGQPIQAAVTNAAFSAGDILSLVAEKTGYPAEMLQLDMELDGDLGIDSIKRVEIFSAFQEKFPEAPVVQSDQLGTLRTLKDVVDFLFGGSASSSVEVKPVLSEEPGAATIRNPLLPEDSSVAKNPLPSGEGRVRGPETAASPAFVPPVARYVVHPVRLPDRDKESKHPLPKDAEVWITDDGSSLPAALVERLAQTGVNARVIGVADQVPPTIPAKLGGLVLLAPSRGTNHDFLVRAFAWTKALAGALRKSKRSALLTVSRMDGSFGFLGEMEDSLSGGLAGLAKTAMQEWPEVRCKAIDLAGDLDADEAAGHLSRELLLAGPSEVGVASDGVRALELSFEPITEIDKSAELRLAHGDVVVVTGGARGVTAEVVSELAQQYRPTIVIFGRSPLPSTEPEGLHGVEERDLKKALLGRAGGKISPKEIQKQYDQILAAREIRENLARFEKAGAAVHYRAVDVRDSHAVAKELERVRQEIGEVRGIVHGAGVLADKRIEDKTVDQFRTVYDTKVLGLEAILESLPPDELKMMVLFSSSTGRLGRVGQVDYAVANEVLNKIAQREARRRPGCRVLSVNWGPWEGGMVNPSLAKIFHDEGIALIPLSSGARYLVEELQSADREPVEVVVLGAPCEAFNASRPIATDRQDAREPLAEQQNGHSLASVVHAANGNATQSAGLTLAFERSLDVATHPFLASHVLDGHAVLPMAVMVEWLAHGALHNNPGLNFQGFDDLRVLKGVVLRGSRPAPIRVFSGKAKREGNSFYVPVELRGINDAGKEVNHASAKIVLASQLETGERRIHHAELGPLNASVAEIYREMLFHGPDLQGIKSVQGCGESGLIADSACSPSPSTWIHQPLRNRWLADPLALDVSFQLMIVWTICMRGAGSLPCHARRYRQYARSFPRDGVQILIEVTQNSQHRAMANVEFVDKRGALIGRMDDYECVIDDSLARAFRHQKLGGRAGS